MAKKRFSMNKKKMLAVVLTLVLLINMLLLAFRLIGFTIFWMIIIAGAVIAYYVMPKIKE